MPYCAEHDIALVTYNSLGQGILTGKFGENPAFPEGDQRSNMILFHDDVWPHVHAGIE